MATRKIVTEEDSLLRKKSRDVENIDERILTLLDDMAETMYEANGVGLAAPQVGVLKKVVVIDIGDGLIELINPEIVSEEGEQDKVEGCLSIPGVFASVKRPAKLTVKALNRKGKKITVKAEDVLAIALSHEIDHLHGVLFRDKVIRYIDSDELANESGE